MSSRRLTTLSSHQRCQGLRRARWRPEGSDLRAAWWHPEVPHWDCLCQNIPAAETDHCGGLPETGWEKKRKEWGGVFLCRNIFLLLWTSAVFYSLANAACASTLSCKFMRDYLRSPSPNADLWLLLRSADLGWQNNEALHPWRCDLMNIHQVHQSKLVLRDLFIPANVFVNYHLTTDTDI